MGRPGYDPRLPMSPIVSCRAADRLVVAGSVLEGLRRLGRLGSSLLVAHRIEILYGCRCLCSSLLLDALQVLASIFVSCVYHFDHRPFLSLTFLF